MSSGRGQMRLEGRLSRMGRAAAIMVVVALAAGTFFGFRTYRTYVLLQSATQTGVSSTSGIRPWMTLGYVAETYGIAYITLAGRLQLSPDTDPKRTLKDLGDDKSLTRIEFAQRVQRRGGYRLDSSAVRFIGVVINHKRRHSFANSDLRLRGLWRNPAARRLGTSIAKRGCGHDRWVATGAGKARLDADVHSWNCRIFFR